MGGIEAIRASAPLDGAHRAAGLNNRSQIHADDKHDPRGALCLATKR